MKTGDNTQRRNETFEPQFDAGYIVHHFQRVFKHFG